MIRHCSAERETGAWLPTETAQTQSRSSQLSPEKAECPIPSRAPAGRAYQCPAPSERTVRHRYPAPQPAAPHQCPALRQAPRLNDTPAPIPPSRRRASPQQGTAASRGWARVRRGKKRASCTLAQLKGGFVGKVRLRFVLRPPGTTIHIRDAFHGGRCHGNACSRCALGRSAMARCSRNAFSASGSGEICADCVPQRPTAAIFRRGTFPGGRSWQYSRAMRSQAASRGDKLLQCVLGRLAVAIFSFHASPKGPRTGKAPLPGNISPPCIQNELALARYARHASEKRRKSPLEDTPRAYLAREGPFSLHGPLESCTGRESCQGASPNCIDPSNHAWGTNLAIARV